MLDTLENIETPEGVSLSVRPAGPYVRFMAQVVDTLIQIVALILLSLLYAYFGGVGVGFVLIAVFVLYWGYHIIYEVYFGGATPGKRLMQLHVVYTNGAPVSLSGSILRNFLRVVDSLPSLYALGAAIAFGNERFQRLGDMAASTVVAYRHSTTSAASLNIDEAPTPLRLALSRGEHKAIAQFSERSATLSSERAAELANLLSPLTGVSDDEAVRALRAHASWWSGRP